MKRIMAGAFLVLASVPVTAFACCVVDLSLPKAELDAVTDQAQRGDRDAMYRLFQHYQLSKDAWSRAYWGERLAELNDTRVLLNLADWYDKLGTPYHCRRAIELAQQRARLASTQVERESALTIARYFAGTHTSAHKCGRK